MNNGNERGSLERSHWNRIYAEQVHGGAYQQGIRENRENTAEIIRWKNR